MIKYEIDRVGGHVIAVSGTLTELQADVTVLIAEIYLHIKAGSEERAKVFLDGLVTCLSDPNSPFFEEVKKNEQE